MAERREKEKDPTNLRGMRRYLTTLAWDKAWIDLIITRVKRRQMATTAVRMKDVVEYLESEGIRNDVICNMCSLNPDILAKDPEDLRATVDFLRSMGIADIPEFIRHHPKLLDYSPSPTGPYLERLDTPSRAVVYTINRDNEQFVNVQYFRSTAQFLKSPISPWMPPDTAFELLEDPANQIGGQ